MLGRTANGLFWMFRYIERAENMARLIDAGIRMSLTRDMVTAEEEWRSVIATAGQRPGYEAKHKTYTGIQAWNWLLRNADNPQSVMSMLQQVRQNGRSARNAISGELWEVINDTWMQANETMAQPLSQDNVTETTAMVRRFATQAHGVMNSSLLRDQGYHFASAGTYIERADSVARILDIKYYLLLPSLSYVGSSLDTGQWDTVLRSVSGDRAYRSLHAGQIDARGIVEFLVLDASFPRSLTFCHSALRDELAALARAKGSEAECDELMRRADMRLHSLTIEDIFEQGLHEFLTEFMSTNVAIAQAIAQDYRFIS